MQSLSEKKREMLLELLAKLLRSAKDKMHPIPFKEFESVVAKIRHAFTSIPAGKGLLTPCNKLLQKHPEFVFLGCNKKLLTGICDMHTLLPEATKNPMKCSELVMGPPAVVGIKDASKHGVGGIIIGHTQGCIPTVFRLEWPQWVKDEVDKTNTRKNGTLTNSDLEMAGLLLLWLIMEDVCDISPGTHLALFSDNSPTVSWTQRLASRGSKVADQLIRALAAFGSSKHKCLHSHHSTLLEKKTR